MSGDIVADAVVPDYVVGCAVTFLDGDGEGEGGEERGEDC